MNKNKACENTPFRTQILNSNSLFVRRNERHDKERWIVETSAEIS